MQDGIPAPSLGLDPLIAEARRRASRRRLFLLTAVLAAVAATAAISFRVRPAAARLGACASLPAGWKERNLPRTATSEATVVLTNFRFGAMDDFFGLSSPLHWPSQGIMVAASNEGPDATPRFRRALHVSRADFGRLEGAPRPATMLGIRTQGRVLTAWVEVGSVTRATVADANAALSGIRACKT